MLLFASVTPVSMLCTCRAHSPPQPGSCLPRLARSCSDNNNNKCLLLNNNNKCVINIEHTHTREEQDMDNIGKTEG